MTQVDPFAAAAANVSDDPFRDPSGGGNFPKPAELLHKLLIMVPVSSSIQQRDGQPPKERWDIDTTVLHEDGTFDTYDKMWWEQTAIASEAAKAFRGKYPLRGTLHLVPAQASKKKFANEEELLADEAIQFWLGRGGAGMPPTQVAWVLQAATPEQAKLTIAWWNEHMNPFGK